MIIGGVNKGISIWTRLRQSVKNLSCLALVLHCLHVRSHKGPLTQSGTRCPSPATVDSLCLFSSCATQSLPQFIEFRCPPFAQRVNQVPQN